MKKYHGVQVRKGKNGEDKKYPIFMGETATSLIVYTTFESLLPFKWDDISVKEDLNSISVMLSNEALPCVEMTGMLKFRLCQDENKASCFIFFPEWIIKERHRPSNILNFFSSVSL